MGKAARAIIIQNDKLLVMRRNKYGSEYYTLVGGRVNEGETIEQALVRKVNEETGLKVTKARLVFFEEHPEPYNQQYTFLCEVAPHEKIEIQETSEEGFMNKMDMNTHCPEWASLNLFPRLQFRTPRLQDAITKALKNGFPDEVVKT